MVAPRQVSREIHSASAFCSHEHVRAMQYLHASKTMIAAAVSCSAEGRGLIVVGSRDTLQHAEEHGRGTCTVHVYSSLRTRLLFKSDRLLLKWSSAGAQEWQRWLDSADKQEATLL